MWIFFVFAIFVGIIIVLNVSPGRKRDEAWRQAAQQLGLQVRGRAICGTLHGFDVRVDTFTRRSNNSSTTYTRIRVTYPRPLGLGINLSKQSFFSGVTKFFGAQDIEIGDARFDGDTVIKGSDHEAIRQFLNPARRLRIHRFMSAHPSAEIRDKEVYVERSGLVTAVPEMVGLVQSALRVAWYICEDRAEDQVVTAALVAQDEGNPEEALRLLGEARAHRESHLQAQRQAQPGQEAPQEVAVWVPVEEAVEETVMEAEILQMTDRKEEASALFAEAQRAAPDDLEIREWVEQTAASVPEPPAESDSGEIPPPQPADTPAVTAAPGAAIEAASFCALLFGSHQSSFKSQALFEQEYEGREIHWTGKLLRAEVFSYDMVFGSDQACRATFEVSEIKESSYRGHTVKAFVRLPKPDAERLRDRVGQPLSFTGQLFKLDALMRNVYITAGQIE